MNNLQRFKYNYPVLKTLSEEIQNSQEEVNLINSNTFGLNEKNKNINFLDKIEIKNLSFKYPNTEKKIIKNLSLSINHGSVIGIVSESGVGKTTLINLLLGLITPDEGDIAVDGNSIF